ncbi:MAG TPA: transglutaminase-like domain-containing protein [Vicinamibacterales bacterium]
MVVLVHRSYLQASPANLATDLARYGATAVWKGVYYRGEKIGFTVSQTVRTEDGFELQEDGRLQMMLLGADTAATIRTTAWVDRSFALRSFEFSLDPGTGAVQVRGTLSPPVAAHGPHRLALAVTSSGATRTELRELPEPPVLSQNLSRVLASGGLVAGARRTWTIFDPATLRNVDVTLQIGRREVVRVADSGVVPAFRVDMEYQGLRTTSWITDTGDVVKEESPLGLVTVRETPERARGLAVPARVQSDLLRLAAVVPALAPQVTRRRIDEPRDVKRLRVRLEGARLPEGDLDGVGQVADGPIIELHDRQALEAGPADPGASRYLSPEPLIESDDPAIVAEARQAIAGVAGTRARAERLTRYVNGLLDKKPTVSLPSARDVLRTKVGDCNEHTALYVAMARSIGIPARIAVGLTYVRGVQGAFYYHAWPEVYLEEGTDRGLWLPVDPTFNQFPADTTHLRLARGGLDKQAAIVPLIGRLQMTIVDIDLAPAPAPVAARRQPAALAALPFEPPARQAGNCRCGR